MFESLVMVALALQPVPLANGLTNYGLYEESARVLSAARPDAGQYAYLMAVNHFQLNQKAEAEKWVRNVLERLGDDPLPVRYVAMANLMAADLKDWRARDEKGLPDLGNIARKMKAVGNNLEVAKGGPRTQGVQKQIQDELDELIKAIEVGPKGDGSGSSSDPQGGPAGKPQQGNGSPQQDSMGGRDSGAGLVDQKKLKDLQENWGKLPEKERSKAMMELTRNLPPRYRETIEKYFKSLAETPPKK